MLDLACPESCSHLQAGRARNRERWFDGFAAYMQGRQGIAKPSRLDFQIGVAADLAIVKAQREQFKDLEDVEILSALDNVISNLETQQSGIIFEHKHSSPRAQQISHMIRTALNEYMADFKEESGTSIPSHKVLEAIKLKRTMVAASLEMDDDRRCYLRYIAHQIPRDDEPAKPLIVLP